MASWRSAKAGAVRIRVFERVHVAVPGPRIARTGPGIVVSARRIFRVVACDEAEPAGLDIRTRVRCRLCAYSYRECGASTRHSEFAVRFAENALHIRREMTEWIKREIARRRIDRSPKHDPAATPLRVLTEDAIGCVARASRRG
ncbi:hypothetical protein [Burkholderia alba]|uniref:hypothetical protein n=1 Tax=Burkholderia alba TaxID=2683677 RepID=UPI002B05A87B|nr:hypothetical protein [Burkholderia alba]